MSTPRVLARLTAADWVRLAEALVVAVCVRIGLRVLSFPKLTSLVDSRARSGPDVPDNRSRIIRAAGAVTRRLPGTTCLAEALTAYTMLRRHGYHANLRIGARNGMNSGIAAHAWVECEGEVVVGRVPEIEGYAVLT